MGNTIKIPPNKGRISVEMALQMIVHAADFPAVVDVFAEVDTDDYGNESAREGGKTYCQENDGKGLAMQYIKASFLSFCDATNTRPRNPYAPWVSDYSGANPSQDLFYVITVEQFQQFASAYDVKIGRSQKPSATPFCCKVPPWRKSTNI